MIGRRVSLPLLPFSAPMSPSAPFMHAITAKVNRMRAPVAALHPLAQFTSARSCYHLRSLHGRSEDRGGDVGVWPDTVAVSKYMWFAWVSPLLRALLPRATWMLSYNRCRVFVCCLVSFWQFCFRLSTLYAVWIGPPKRWRLEGVSMRFVNGHI